MSTTARQGATFLFTDIEGSTRLWSRYPVAMAAAVHQQEFLLRHAIESSGGSVFKTVGDGVYAVFAAPVNAVLAAVAAQRALVTEPWTGFDAGDSIRVRMALHTGEAEAREGDYFGPTLNRLSRLLAAGHGGQVLCTDATLAACGDEWPPEIGLRDLGQRTLRDVPGSGRIFQLVAAGMPEHFPPLDTLDPRVHNLPRWSSAMVGREADADRLRSAVRPRENRMVTVLGTGGVGKTRLTTEVAAQLLDEQQDGIRFVDLSALREDGQVVPAVVQATGAADNLLAPRDALLDWLRDRELLLVLDNCEQVAGGVAALCSDIQQVAPRVTVLATSRVPIRVRGERQLALEPLPLPAERGETALGNPAVRLFAQRAQEVSESFTLSADNAGDVADICRSVDGLPLGIELAAAWVRILSPEALQRRLGESRAILRDGARDLPDRQRALASTIAWSYELLEPDDQRAFRRLAVFRGGIAVDAAAAVIWEAPVSDPLWALSRLDALVQASLLQVSTDQSGEPRFLMLQTVQEFALGILRDSGEWEAASLAHAGFFAGLAQDASTHYRTETSAPWLDRLELDFENLRAAIECYSTHRDLNSVGLNLLVSLAVFLDQRCHVTQARAWFDMLYTEGVPYAPELHVEALIRWGNTWFSDPLVARAHYRRAIQVAIEAGMPHLSIRPIASSSIVFRLSGDYESALSMANDVVSFGERESMQAYRALGYYRIAQAECDVGQLDLALTACQEARAAYRAIQDPDGEAWVWATEGRVYRKLGDITAAEGALNNALSRFQEVGDEEAIGMCELEWGLAWIGIDNLEAQRSLDSAVARMANVNDAYSMIALLEGVAQLSISLGALEVAANLIGAARRLRNQTGIVASPGDAEALRKYIDQANVRMGTATFDLLLERSRELSPRIALERYCSYVR